MQRLTVLCLALTIFLAGCVNEAPVREEVETKPVPTISLPTSMPSWMGTDHTNVTHTHEEFSNGSYMAYFSAPWCAHCEPTIDAYDTIIPAGKIVVFSMEAREEYSNMSEWHNDTETNLNRTIDRPFIRDPSLAKALEVRSMPHAIFINQQGYVFHVQVGKITNATTIQAMWDTTELTVFDTKDGWSHEFEA
jgi:hypothetical protein